MKITSERRHAVKDLIAAARIAVRDHPYLTLLELTLARFPEGRDPLEALDAEADDERGSGP